MAEYPYEKMNIQWFPGHMTKAQRMIEENLKLVDAVCEILDARIPRSSRNPDIDRLAGDKPRLLILNRIDLADPAVTARWRRSFEEQGLAVLETDARSGKGVKDFAPAVRRLLKDKLADYEAKGQVGRTLRVMILGIPNVGKSTFINRLHGSAIVKAGDRPGVTRANQWVKLGPFLEILDTPGMLPPRLDDQEGARLLACLGSIRDEIMDTEDLAGGLMALLYDLNPAALRARYKLPEDCDAAPHALLEAACRGRGWLLSGGRYDTDRAAALVLDEFRAGKIGKITIEEAGQ